MREFALALLIVVASLSVARASTVPTMPPSTYPVDGTFCGVLTLCTPKAAGRAPSK
ncbi:MAG: hypothetical protein AAFU63_13490 [Pseudomonadota bacterium]